MIRSFLREPKRPFEDLMEEPVTSLVLLETERHFGSLKRTFRAWINPGPFLLISRIFPTIIRDPSEPY